MVHYGIYRLEYWIGAINDELAENWQAPCDNPFDVLADPIVEVRPPLGSRGFDDLDEYLHDKKDIDWGSFAYRGTRTDFTRLLKAWKLDLKTIEFMNDDEQYGFVFIENW